MTKILSDPLLTAGKIITVFAQAIMAIGAAATLIGIPVVLFAQAQITAEVRAEIGDPDFVLPTLAIIGILLIAFVIVALIFLFFDRLRRIIGTVGEGDPFVPENAKRLSLMAWLMLAVQILTIPAAALGLYIAEAFSEVEGMDTSVDLGIDAGGIVLIITLFILARVFRKGTEMRAELEGTV